MGQWYGLEQNDRIFPYTKNIVNHVMARACEAVGVKKIRVHDIRHSHASMLVELGFSPLLIAERLGHERVQTTMETYSHLYPNKQAEVAMQLDGLPPATDGYQKTIRCSHFCSHNKKKIPKSAGFATLFGI